MKCPECKSSRYQVLETDPALMWCEDCLEVHSVSWVIGYWHGFLDGQREEKQK